MSFYLSVRLARRELRGGLKNFRILIACLALGVAAITALESIKQAIETGLKVEGAVLLGGDAEAEFVYRFASQEERSGLEEIGDQISEVADFRSMIVVRHEDEKVRALTQIKAIDSAYPLIGQVQLFGGSDFRAALTAQDGLSSVLMERILVDRLGLRVGDRLYIGSKSFRLGGILKSLPDTAGDNFGLGPRTLVYKADLEGSGLLGPGTFFSSKYRLITPTNSDPDAIKTLVKDRFSSSGLKWRDSRNAAPGVAVFVERLSVFLVLIALSGLAVAGVGVSAAVTSYLAIKKPVIATLRSLGATNYTVFQIYFMQIAFLSVLGVAIGVSLGAGLPILFAQIIDASLPFPVHITFYGFAALQAALYGFLIAAIFMIWPLARIENIQTASLFRNLDNLHRALPSVRYLVSILILAVGLLLSSAYFTGSFRFTMWFFAGVLLTSMALLLSAFFLKYLAKKIMPFVRGRPALRWALGSISGPDGSMGRIVVALGLGLSALASIGQIEGNLRKAINSNLPKVAPSFFFVDIQKTQTEDFYRILEDFEGVSRIEMAPMLRGVVSKVNGRTAEEVVGAHWVLQGDRGLTYSETPPVSSKVVEGEWWPKNYIGANQISFAAKEAAEMGLKLGDELTVNIMGREILGKITSFRNVDFSTAGIGFIMSMNPSALEHAPHSLIATVYAEPESEVGLLNDLANAFPNITAIRIKDVIERASLLLGSIAAAASYGAAITLLTGFLVLVGSAASDEHARRFEACVLKTLGAKRSTILTSFALRSIIMGGGAAIIALLCGFLASWATCQFVFDIKNQVVWPNVLAILIAGILANLLAGLFFAIRALNSKPAAVLRNYE